MSLFEKEKFGFNTATAVIRILRKIITLLSILETIITKLKRWITLKKVIYNAKLFNMIFKSN